MRLRPGFGWTTKSITGKGNRARKSPGDGRAAGRSRRRDDGRRDRAGWVSRRAGDPPLRSLLRGVGGRREAPPRGPGEGRRAGAVGPAGGEGRRREASRNPATRGPRPLRAGDRGGARGPGTEAGAVAPPRGDLRRGDGPRNQHLVASGDGD